MYRDCRPLPEPVETVVFVVAAGVLAIAVTTLLMSRLRPAAPTVERSSVLTDTVKRGAMVRNVRGLGTLVPEVIRWIPVETAGRVERIFVRPGATVTPDTIVLELSNPSEAQALVDLEGQKRVAEAELTTLRARIENELVSQEATVVAIDSEYRQATLQATADAAHMAVAAYHGVDFLMTCNVAHIANAALRRRVEDVCRGLGYGAPVLCMPDELMEDADE